MQRTTGGRFRLYYEAWGPDLPLLVDRVPKYCMRRLGQSPIRAIVNSFARMSGCCVDANPVGEMKDAVTGRMRDIYELHVWGLPGRAERVWGKEMLLLWVAVYQDRQMKLPGV